MLAKVTSKNQITLPKAVLSQIASSDYYEVQAENGRIVLTPVKINNMERVWDRLEALGITEQDVADAVQWARQEPASSAAPINRKRKAA